MAYSPLTQVKQVLDDIKDYITRLWFLAEMRNSAWRLQVDATWSVTASIASAQTLATLTNQTNIGWYGAQNQIPALMNMETTLGNIDNIYIS